MYPFGSIVLARFPFTDLSGSKLRPVLVVSRENDQRTDLVACFITSSLRVRPRAVPIVADQMTGLRVPSMVHFDKIGTLHLRLIEGWLGEVSDAWLTTHRKPFWSVFGFARYSGVAGP